MSNNVESAPVADPIPVDPNIEDDASDNTDAESIRTSSTASLSESIREYREIHGRTYTQKTEYWGPNDEKQNDAQDFNHYWLTDFFDGELYLAQIGANPQRVLDLGTGTGIWAIDFADKHPSAEVIGIDLSPIQPSWVPSNCKFLIDDFEKEWTWPTNYFDFVHARNLEGCFADLPNVLQEVHDHLKPGGWFEVKEFEIMARSQTQELDDDHVFNRWYRYASEAQDKLGKPHSNALKRRFAKGLDKVGFVEIVEKKWKIPIGTWPAKPELKRLGACNLEFFDQSLEGFMLFLLKEVLGFTYEEVQLMISEVRAELRNPKNTPYYYLHAVYARRPLEHVEKSEDNTAEA